MTLTRKLSGLCLSAAIAATMATTPNAAEKFHKLAAEEIRAKLSGMEITDEVHWAELYNRDGTLTTWNMAKKAIGTWSAKGGELCLNEGRKPTDCKEVWLSGDKIEFRYSGGGVATEGVLRKQQPRS